MLNSDRLMYRDGSPGCIKQEVSRYVTFAVELQGGVPNAQPPKSRLPRATRTCALAQFESWTDRPERHLIHGRGINGDVGAWLTSTSLGRHGAIKMQVVLATNKIIMQKWGELGIIASWQPSSKHVFEWSRAFSC
jgi:hypothetical protein